MSAPSLTRQEAVGLDKKREDRRTQQPYANELDDRELEHAHRESRPVDPRGATTTVKPDPRLPPAPVTESTPERR